VTIWGPKTGNWGPEESRGPKLRKLVKVDQKSGQNRPFLKNREIPVKKSRPPAVTKIFMPDFRHAHTLQQYTYPNKDVLCPCLDTPIAMSFVFLSSSIYCLSLSFVVALCDLSRPEGVLENQVLIVVVCGHDESPA